MRRFQLGDKIWAIEQKQLDVQLAWGTEGRAQQRLDKKFATATAATAYTANSSRMRSMRSCGPRFSRS